MFGGCQRGRAGSLGGADRAAEDAEDQQIALAGGGDNFGLDTAAHDAEIAPHPGALTEGFQRPASLGGLGA